MSNPRPRVKTLFKNLRSANLFCVKKKKSLMRMLREKFKSKFPKRKGMNILIKIQICFGFFLNVKKMEFFMKIPIFCEKCRFGFNKKEDRFLF